VIRLYEFPSLIGPLCLLVPAFLLGLFRLYNGICTIGRVVVQAIAPIIPALPERGGRRGVELVITVAVKQTAPAISVVKTT